MGTTIYDIAQKADVSKSTVSRVLNDDENVAQDTRKKVLKVMEETNFQGNFFARRIKSKKSKIIGVIHSSNKKFLKDDPFYFNVFNGIVKMANNSGYNVNYINAAQNSSSEKLKILLNGNAFDGYIVIGERYDLLINLLENMNCPVVLVDTYDIYHDWPRVITDNFGGIKKATKHLYELGHRDIGFIYPINQKWGIPHSYQERLNSFRISMGELGLKTRSKTIKSVLLDEEKIDNFTYESLANHLISLGKSMSKKYVNDLANPPSCILAANDLLAIGLIKGFKELKIKVPEDISIIGFDDIHLAAHFQPSLSTIKVYKEKMGEIAFKKLNQLIAGNKQEVKDKTIISVDLICRESIDEYIS
ncbi:MAG: LacI family DNA-binding transcriptional regulator [Bacillota bacterium]